MRRFVLIMAALLVFAGCVYAENGGIPGQARNDAAIHEPITIGANTEWPLDGILSIPADATAENPAPALIIVAGSGPNNMDGRIELPPELLPPGLVLPDNAIYRDIAEYLAASGVAVIRHDKRTLTHGAAIVAMGGEATVYHEFIADALLAAEILRADARIDSNRIFILGHSQGGAIIPRIHMAGGDFAGLIFAATTPRSMIVLAAEQTMADINFQWEHITPEMQTDPNFAPIIAQMEGLQAMIEADLEVYARLNDMTADEAQNTAIMGIFGSYLLDMQNYPLADLASQIDVPMLIIHAERDFQITTATDLPLMRQIFENLPNATIRVYPDLNHMLMPTTATNFSEHAAQILMNQGQVDPQLLRGIVDWILGN
ncbi:MAG: lysophospholipase [Clostridiales bacterium]|jgi:alpha-beta hydrolase superfamily lysophospholipase|nr:lysophospholipase [Clostridiales bacterium]